MSTVPLTGTGGFFTRQGAFIGEFNRVAAFYGSGLAVGFQSIWSQFASSDQAAVQNLPDAVTAFGNSGLAYQNTLVADGMAAITLQVNDNVSVVPYTVQQALTLLIAQMVTNSQSIQRATLTSVVTPWADNLGDAVVVTSTTNQFGDPLDMVFAETVTVTCVNPSPNFGEGLSAVGVAAVSPNSAAWPAGSGCSTTLNVLNQSSTGIVTDGGFANWSGSGSNTPTNWPIADGTPGVTVFKSAAGGVRSGTDAAKILSDGAQATQLTQNVSLQINTVYAVCAYVKVNSLDASGSFVISFTDADGNILTNDAGADLTYTRNLNGQVTTGYQIFTAFFSTPRQLPTTVNVQVGFGAAPTAGRFLTLDLVGVVQATQLYVGGPFMSAFAGADPTALGDYYTVAYTNSLTSQSFARGADRLFSLRQLGVYYPSSLSATVSDSLVTH